ncbi:MAG: methyltransferase domain-containing protein [Candidatus Paceibacterota bacterium]|jgi:predicted O-methyltransferase YrrM
MDIHKLAQRIENLINQKTIFNSKRNGKIKLSNFLGEKQIIVDGIEQSGPYMSGLIKKAIHKVPKKHPVKHVLMLGLGFGCGLKYINRRFPKAHVTIFEWDETMAEIAKNHGNLNKKNPPEIILGDAIQSLEKINQKFDIIIIDIFSGGNPEPRLVEEQTLQNLKRILENDGYILFNAFKEIRMFEPFKKEFSLWQQFKFRLNNIALFRNFGMGRKGDLLPDNFVHPSQSKKYLLGGSPSKKSEIIGVNGCLGIRWNIGPIYIDSYVSDIEPKIDDFSSFRIIVWNRISNISKPKHWFSFPLDLSPSAFCISDLKNMKDKYFINWTDRAKRYRKKWLSNTEFEIVETDFQTFSDAYKKFGKIPRHMISMFLTVLKKQIAIQPENSHLIIARSLKSKQIISGMAFIHLPDISESMHVISFYDHRFAKTGVGTGIIDFWFKNSAENNIRFLNWGAVFMPGNPNKWKGFTEFKYYFNPFIIRNSEPLFKFVFGKKKK